MAHGSPEPSVNWTPSRKVVSQFVANVLTGVAAMLVARLGLHVSPYESAVIASAIGIVAGAVAGYVVREVPVIEKDVTAQS
jgi:uncharacterized membrane protein